jgi:hypothetical protein
LRFDCSEGGGALRLGEEGGDTLVGLSSHDLPLRWEDMTYNGLENCPLVRISKACMAAAPPLACCFHSPQKIPPQKIQIFHFLQNIIKIFPVQPQHLTLFSCPTTHF